MIAYDKIRELREEYQWSQEYTAELLGMSKNGYAKIERGESRPSLERLEQIAKIFNISILELLQVHDKQVILQTQNHNANYHYNHYASDQQLHAEIEKLKLILQHKDEIIAEKNAYIQVLKKLANLDQDNTLLEL